MLWTDKKQNLLRNNIKAKKKNQHLTQVVCRSVKSNALEQVSIRNENATKKSIRKLHLNAQSTPMWSKVKGQSREYLSRYTETMTDRHELNPQISSSSSFLNSLPQKRNSHEPRFFFSFFFFFWQKLDWSVLLWSCCCPRENRQETKAVREMPWHLRVSQRDRM